MYLLPQSSFLFLKSCIEFPRLMVDLFPQLRVGFLYSDEYLSSQLHETGDESTSAPDFSLFLSPSLSLFLSLSFFFLCQPSYFFFLLLLLHELLQQSRYIAGPFLHALPTHCLVSIFRQCFPRLGSESVADTSHSRPLRRSKPGPRGSALIDDGDRSLLLQRFILSKQNHEALSFQHNHEAHLLSRYNSSALCSRQTTLWSSNVRVTSRRY